MAHYVLSFHDEARPAEIIEEDYEEGVEAHAKRFAKEHLKVGEKKSVVAHRLYADSRLDFRGAVNLDFRKA